MKIALSTALMCALLTAPVLAQGNSPYNRSGSQAGGPLGGQERRLGAPGGTPAVDPARSTQGAVRSKGRTKAAKHFRRRHAL
ncbi:hypothetical protein LOK46_30460 (plasmid) [Methylobacterium sp. NMS14P]|nr:hypothetical protein [Methylobacterium sp. NMS14P]WCS28715.1 hypothetical protein LOK46_30460 [Methylobacterium sp. NMS14P]